MLWLIHGLWGCSVPFLIKFPCVYMCVCHGVCVCVPIMKKVGYLNTSLYIIVSNRVEVEIISSWKRIPIAAFGVHNRVVLLILAWGRGFACLRVLLHHSVHVLICLASSNYFKNGAGGPRELPSANYWWQLHRCSPTKKMSCLGPLLNSDNLVFNSVSLLLNWFNSIR